MDSSRTAAGWRADAYPGLVALVTGVVVLLLSSRLEYRQIIANDPLSPASVPTALGVLLVLGGAALVVRGLRRRPAVDTGGPADAAAEGAADATADAATPATATDPRRRWWQVAATLAACALFALLLPVLGFAVSAPLLVLVTTMIAAGVERVAFAVSLAVAVPLACYLIFSGLLDLPLPLVPAAG